MCLLEIAVFGCNILRLLPKINVHGEFWVERFFHKFRLSGFQDSSSDAIPFFVVLHFEND